ncbi:hypothetical protein NSQ59_07475 [Margalitia sp. FSL K6-0131]|uniref:hypothetical protein n=1 Tax=Margalitia sp. FSL K6-0131 TaxID=2954604 RepID=UPI0030FBAD6B
MNLAEFKKIIDQIGFPVTYSHFTPTTDNPVPQPPYICYLVDGNPNFIADNKVFYKITDVTIELYTLKKDLAAEAKIEKVLDDHEIPYVSYGTFIESEKLFQIIYEVRLI